MVDKKENYKTKPKKDQKIFFEKQKDDSRCRMHSINNALGRPAISREK